VRAASVAPGAAAGPDGAGRLVGDGLVTRDGRLILHEVQPAGGKRMPWADYVRGRPAILGADVVPVPPVAPAGTGS
jgi:methionyl-tRNA formyltransferase